MLIGLTSYTPKNVSKERMTWAIDILLSLQNPDGGFASYELIRGTRYMELINPAEVFVGRSVQVPSAYS